ncbi:MAG TPA: hypothetical protein VLG28_01340 [Acidimicrobiia bacterium]|jgi:hypothetical protein|nr:hypothetical protein [Acidimicrobiia bacterium]
MKALGNKLLRTAMIVGAGVVIMRFAGPRLNARVERMFEEAPEDFPPKWMYLNITAIRDNTERILEALQQEPGQSGTEAA